MLMGTTHARWIHLTVHNVVGVLVWLFGLPSILLAHGSGITGEEVRPIAVSGALALISYWTVILWPKRKKADPDYRAPLRQMQSGPARLKMMFARRRDGDSSRDGDSRGRARPLKQVPHLRQVPRIGGCSYESDSVSNG
jgi:hypothetical protein